ncbi:hypothetical protein ABZP36_001876 [Zizania latifolia]
MSMAFSPRLVMASAPLSPGVHAVVAVPAAAIRDRSRLASLFRASAGLELHRRVGAAAPSHLVVRAAGGTPLGHLGDDATTGSFGKMLSDITECFVNSFIPMTLQEVEETGTIVSVVAVHTESVQIAAESGIELLNKILMDKLANSYNVCMLLDVVKAGVLLGQMMKEGKKGYVREDVVVEATKVLKMALKIFDQPSPGAIPPKPFAFQDFELWHYFEGLTRDLITVVDQVDRAMADAEADNAV